jgi:hypothetical protein
MKLIISILAILVLISATAAASMIIPANENAKEHSKAPEKSPVIGDNWDLERVDFIHYAKQPSGGSKPGADTCYKLMGVKWSTLPVSYVINPANPDGLAEDFVSSIISTGAEAWDSATSKELLNNAVGIDYNAVYGVRDYKNAVVFGDYPDSNAIAVTSIWYTKVGKQIVEFDMIFNTRFDWGDASANPAIMDLQNIATHEFGHSVGLNDIYTSTCSAVIMYGYSSNGDIAKRTLEQADVKGLQAMYGP